MRLSLLAGAAAIIVTGVIAASGVAGQTPAPAPGVGAPAAKPPARVPSRGETLFLARCADCHDPPAGEATPAKEDIAGFVPADLVAVMETGRMVGPAEGLSHQDIQAIAAWLTGTPEPKSAPPPPPVAQP